jgi:hypothetical protein
MEDYGDLPGMWFRVIAAQVPPTSLLLPAAMIHCLDQPRWLGWRGPGVNAAPTSGYARNEQHLSILHTYERRRMG